MGMRCACCAQAGANVFLELARLTLCTLACAWRVLVCACLACCAWPTMWAREADVAHAVLDRVAALVSVRVLRTSQTLPGSGFVLVLTRLAGLTGRTACGQLELAFLACRAGTTVRARVPRRAGMRYGDRSLRLGIYNLRHIVCCQFPLCAQV